MPTVKGCHGGWRDLCPYACTCGGHVPPSCCPARDGRNRARGSPVRVVSRSVFPCPSCVAVRPPMRLPGAVGQRFDGSRVGRPAAQVQWAGGHRRLIPRGRRSGPGGPNALPGPAGGASRPDPRRTPSGTGGPRAVRDRPGRPWKPGGRPGSTPLADAARSPCTARRPPLRPLFAHPPVLGAELPCGRCGGGRERAGRAPRGHPSDGAFPPVRAVKSAEWTGSWCCSGGRVKSPALVVRGRGRASRGPVAEWLLQGCGAAGAWPAPGWCGRARTGGRVRLRRGVSRSPVCGGRRGLGVPVSNPRTPPPCGRSGRLPGSGTGTRSGSAPGGGSGRGRRPPGGSGTVIDRAPVHRVCDSPGRPECPAPYGLSGPVRSVPSPSVRRRFGAV